MKPRSVFFVTSPVVRGPARIKQEVQLGMLKDVIQPAPNLGPLLGSLVRNGKGKHKT